MKTVLGVRVLNIRAIQRPLIDLGAFRHQRHSYGLRQKCRYVTLCNCPWKSVWYHIGNYWEGIAEHIG